MLSKSKKLLCLIGATALATTGCASISQTGSISKNGQITQETTIQAEKTATDQFFQELSRTSFITLGMVQPGVKTIEKDGKSYYSIEEKVDTTIAKMYDQKLDGEKIIESMIASGGAVYDTAETCLNLDTATILNELTKDQEVATNFDALLKQVTMNMTITFPYKVTKTNGTLSGDGYTVTFGDAQCKSGRQYAYTEKDYTLSGIKEGGISSGNQVSFSRDISVREGTKTLASGSKLSDGSHLLTANKGDVQKTIYTIIDTKGPVFQGIKNKKYYNQNIYTGVSDATTSVASLTLDKKNQTEDPTLLQVTKNGKHTAIAKDLAGNTSKITFYLDKKKPTVKGIKHGKTYKKAVKITCKDNMKLKSVKVNGKKKKNTFKIKKKGSYTIVAKDQAGNQTKVKIKIK